MVVKNGKITTEIRPGWDDGMLAVAVIFPHPQQKSVIFSKKSSLMKILRFE